VPPESPESYYSVARQIVAETPVAGTATSTTIQSTSGALRSTGPEIWRQTRGRIDFFVTTMGTCGTISGTGRYLKEQNPTHPRRRRRSRGLDPAPVRRDRHDRRGAPVQDRRHRRGHHPDDLHKQYVDEVVTVNDRQSLNMAVRVVREEGLLVGGLGGAAVRRARSRWRAGRRHDRHCRAVPDYGERYLQQVHSDEWMKENRLLDGFDPTVGEVLERAAARHAAAWWRSTATARCAKRSRWCASTRCRSFR
jgi:cystathionine beta-synthase